MFPSKQAHFIPPLRFVWMFVLCGLLLNGCGTQADQAAPAAPLASLSSNAITFASSTVGVAAAAVTVTLTNTGGSALLLTGVALSNTTDFALTTTCGAALAAGAGCSLSVQFTPHTAAALTGTLTLTDSSGGFSGAQQVIGLSGTGTPVPLPMAVLAPASLSFGAAVLRTATAAQTLTLSNPGTAALQLGGIALSDTADFSLGPSTCGSSLEPGASCTIAVAFTPQTLGPLSGTLTPTSNSGGVQGTQHTVTLSGTGLPFPVPQLVFSPAALGFAATVVKTSTAPQLITLSNTGTAALTFAAITLDDNANFSLAGTCGATLAVSATCTLAISFNPQTTGLVSSTLTLTDNSGVSAGSTQQTISLSGSGLPVPAPLALLTPTALAFPDTTQGLSATPQTVTLTNTGNAPLVLNGITLSDTANFTLSSTCAAALAPAASCTLAVGFTPQSVAAFAATLSVADNSGSSTATGTAQQTVAIAARGIAFDARAALSPATLVFPQTVTNASAAAQTATLSNAGTESLSVTSVAISGVSAAAFHIASGSCVGSLAAGASCALSIVYSPTLGSATDSASLVFTDNAMGQPGSMQTVALSGSAIAEVDSVENFGDSITCGFYAQPRDGAGLVWSLEGYAGLFDTALGVPAQNWCRQGDTAADLSRQWVPFHSTPVSTANQLFTVMVGTNDAYRYGIPQGALQTYTAEVAAAVSWLAIPNSDKVLANTIAQRTGTWNQDVGFGVLSSDAGASLSFEVNQAAPGRELYLVYHVWALPYGQAGKASISVDGAVQATVDESQNAGVYIPTENGTYDTFLAQAVPLGAVGPHTITFSSVGPAGSAVGLLWAGVAQQDYRSVDGAPEVLLGYVPNSPSGNQTYVADIYTQQLQSLIPALVVDGMNVKAVNTSRVMDTNTDFADILHPNNSGHAKLAAAFQQAR